MVAGLFLAGLLAGAGPGVAGAPSLAVMGLDAKGGVSTDVAVLLSGHLADRMRASGRFGRVITNQEIDAMLGLEKQRQLLQCDSQSCMAELAGALGVDFIITGQVGRLGERRLITVSLINTRLARTERSASRQVQGDEGALLDAMDAVAAQLLDVPVATLTGTPAAGTAPSKPAAPTPEKPAAPPPAANPSPAPTTADPPASPTADSTTTAAPAPVAANTQGQPTNTPSDAPATGGGGGMLGRILMATGGAVALAGVLPLLVALGGGGLATLVLVGARTGLLFSGLGMGPALFPAFLGGTAVAGLGVVLTLGLVAAGVATLVAGVVVP